MGCLDASSHGTPTLKAEYESYPARAVGADAAFDQQLHHIRAALARSHGDGTVLFLCKVEFENNLNPMVTVAPSQTRRQSPRLLHSCLLRDREATLRRARGRETRPRKGASIRAVNRIEITHSCHYMPSCRQSNRLGGVHVCAGPNQRFCNLNVPHKRRNVEWSVSALFAT